MSILRSPKKVADFWWFMLPRMNDRKKAIQIVHPYGLKFAEKYNRLTLEELA